jgi:hypothetical protein
MEAVLDPILDRIVNTLTREFDVRRIVLFGSRAMGTNRVDSDYDVLVEVASDIPYWERQQRGYAAFGLRDWGLDLIIKTGPEMDRSRQLLGSVANTADSEGRVIYART